MKRIYSLLVIGTLSVILSAVPLTTKASDVLEVTYNNSSTINNSQYTGTLDDGTVLGFYRSGNCTSFCGAITSATALVVPEKILYSGTEYKVNYFGHIDFDEAPNVTSLTLPSTLTDISSYVPSSVSELHLLGTTPPRIYSSGYISSSTTVYVSQSAYGTYQNYWSTSIDLRFEGWEPQSYTVTVNTAGKLANQLLSVVEQWTDVGELTIIGHLNSEDMKIFSRMTQLRKLDLSQTDITIIEGCASLSKLKTVLLPSTVKIVGSNAFRECVRLNDINLNNIEEIGDYAFYRCISLTNPSLMSVISVGDYSFAMSTNYSNFYDWYEYEMGGVQRLDLPKAISIGKGAFSGCIYLYSVSVPSAQTIGDIAFANCYNNQ